MCRQALAEDAPSGLLPRADAAWTTLNGRKWFGSHHMDILPSAWARNVLGASICRALSNHLLASVHRSREDGVTSSKTRQTILGAGSRTSAYSADSRPSTSQQQIIANVAHGFGTCLGSTSDEINIATDGPGPGSFALSS